jgi:hypothetical protein
VKTHTHVSLSDNPTFDPKQKVIILHNVVKKTCNIFLYNEKSKQYISCYPYVVVFFSLYATIQLYFYRFPYKKIYNFFLLRKYNFFPSNIKNILMHVEKEQREENKKTINSILNVLPFLGDES